MGTTGQMLITAGAVLSAGILLLTTYNRVYRWTLRQKAQDRELSAIRKENTLLTYGVLACLKGLEEQGCDGPVHEAIDKIERDLKLRMKQQGWKRWWRAAGVRAIKTMAQTAVATIGAAAVLCEVSWDVVGSAAVLAGLLSLLTSLAGLPEVEG